MTKDRRRMGLLKAGALHLFNAGAKRMLGYTGAEAEPFMQALGEVLEFAARERAEESDRAFASARSH